MIVFNVILIHFEQKKCGINLQMRLYHCNLRPNEPPTGGARSDFHQEHGPGATQWVPSTRFWYRLSVLFRPFWNLVNTIQMSFKKRISPILKKTTIWFYVEYWVPYPETEIMDSGVEFPEGPSLVRVWYEFQERKFMISDSKTSCHGLGWYQ